MIRIGRISDLSNDFDENWLVVRVLKGDIPPHAIHEPRLSPSRQLFHKYLEAKADGKLNAEWFQQVYAKAYLREIITDRKNLLLLDRLYQDSYAKSILLAGLCEDETLCHRSILAGMLAGAGAKIVCNVEYKKYYKMFQELIA